MKKIVEVKWLLSILWIQVYTTFESQTKSDSKNSLPLLTCIKHWICFGCIASSWNLRDWYCQCCLLCIIQLSWDFWCWKTDFLLSIAAKCSLTIKVDFHSSVYSWLFTVWFNAMKYIFWTYSEVELKIKDWSHCMKQSIIVRPEMHCVGNCVVIRYCYKAICNGEMELFREKCLLSKSILLLLFNIWTILLLFGVCHLALEAVH